MATQADGALNGVNYEAVFHRLVQACPGPVIISRLSDSVIFDANPAFLETFGYTRDEIIGQSALTLGMWALPEERARIKNQLESKGCVRHALMHGKTKSGEIRQFFVAIEYVPGTVEQTILVIGQDITESSHFAAQLEDGAKRWRTTFDAIADMIVIVGRNHRIIDANKAFRELVGDSHPAGRTSRELFEKAIPSLIACWPTETFSKGTHTHIEICEPTLNNRWFNVHTYAIKDDLGHVKQVVHVIRDITERKQLEDQLRHATKMEAVGRLAGGVAHDFNNLLTAITGYSDLALSRIKPDDPIQNELKEIRKAGERAASLTTQLLAFSRRRAMQPIDVQINNIIADMKRILTHMLGENINLNISAADNIAGIRADPVQIQQVIINLAVNARDAMPDGGELALATANVDLEQPLVRSHCKIPAGRYVALTLRDNGTGMDEATQARIFEPFYTTKQETSGAGLGLGLSTVYGIVKQAGGHICVNSATGQGTTIDIYFPRTEPIDSLEAARARADALRGTETILLVEDEDSVRKLAATILRSHGYRVIEAEGGVEALRISRLHQGPIHLLLSDVVLPRVSGPSVAERMVDFKPQTKVLFMSGYTEESALLKGVLNRKAAFLPKPFTPERLAAKVREVLDSPAAPPPE